MCDKSRLFPSPRMQMECGVGSLCTALCVFQLKPLFFLVFENCSILLVLFDGF